MALTLVNLSGFQRGIESAETGINVDSFSCRYYPEWKNYVANYQGQALGFAIPSILSREVNVSGEVTGATGIMAAVFATALVFANDVATFLAVSAGSSAGGFYVDEVTESQTRDGWRSVSMKATSNPLIS